MQPAVAGRPMVEEALEDSDDSEPDEVAALSDEAGGEEAEVGPDKPTALEEDADEFEDLTNLNMPSWAELVGSLYRPPDR